MINPSFWLKWQRSVILAAPLIAEWYYSGNYYIRVAHGNLISITGGRDISLQESVMLALEPYGLICLESTNAK